MTTPMLPVVLLLILVFLVTSFEMYYKYIYALLLQITRICFSEQVYINDS